jgi:hypothetical protein
VRKAGVQEADIAAVLGHEHPHISSKVYGHNGLRLSRLRETVEKINYPEGVGFACGRRRPPGRWLRV